eukprot:scaffold157147_cov36-Prasinocladus_malaysianus.AAC.1
MARAAGLIKKSPSPTKDRGPLYDILYALASALLNGQQQPAPSVPSSGLVAEPPQTAAVNPSMRAQPEFESVRSIEVQQQKPKFDNVLDVNLDHEERRPGSRYASRRDESSKYQKDEQRGEDGSDVATRPAEGLKTAESCADNASSRGTERSADDLAKSMEDWVVSRVVAEMLVKRLGHDNTGESSQEDVRTSIERGKLSVAKSLQALRASVPALSPAVDPAMAELVTYEEVRHQLKAPADLAGQLFMMQIASLRIETTRCLKQALAELIGQHVPENCGPSCGLGAACVGEGAIVGGGATGPADASGQTSSMEDALMQLILQAIATQDDDGEVQHSAATDETEEGTSLEKQPDDSGRTGTSVSRVGEATPAALEDDPIQPVG